MAKSNNSSKLPPFVRPSAKIHPANDPEADPYSYSLEKFRLYETKAVRQIVRYCLGIVPWISQLQVVVYGF